MDHTPAASLVNQFAAGLANAFALTAKGMDASSERFLRARPHEKILTGFLTPSRASGDEDDRALIAGYEPPELPADEPFEQSSIGFEWCVPAQELPNVRLVVRAGLAVYARVIPSFSTARENAFYDRAGKARLVEEWRRFKVADIEQEPLKCTISFDGFASDHSTRILLSTDTLLTKLQTLLETFELTLFQGSQEVTLAAEDLVDESTYTHRLNQLLTSRHGTRADWRPGIDLRLLPAPSEPGCVRVMLRLVNFTDPVTRQEAAFKDPRLYAVALEATFSARAHRDTQFRALPSSYRYDRAVRAIGINCKPHVEQQDGDLTISSDTVPIAQAPRIVPREIVGGAALFGALSRQDCGVPILQVILDAMRNYDAQDWQHKIDALGDPDEKDDATRDREAFRAEIAAFSIGIDLLRNEQNREVRSAFQLMNESMERLGRSRRRPFDKWHLFQIVFIVSTLPALVRGVDTQEEGARLLHLLWFPAGGGKTEAFVGLIVWQAFYDRLRGKLFGITAFLRYPLRLLTYQQLQRLGLALGCADTLRLEHRIPGAPFSLGYFVGETTTPNSISSERHEQLLKSGVPADYQRVFKCPRCFLRTVSLRYNAALRLIEHYCTSNDCPTRGRRLPVYIVDDDLYRYLPTVIVSTVDKLAGLGQNRRFAQLFGRIEFVCPEHGAAFAGSNRLCAASLARLRGERPAACGESELVWGPFTHLTPSLHIQDELHLLRESLATFDSHYETAAMAVQDDLGGASWTLVGSTATIAGYKEQARQLYQSDALRFPGPGPEAYESFYYYQESPFLGRIYVGVLGVGRSHTPSVARTLGLLYSLVEQVRVQAPRDADSVRRLLALPQATAEQLAVLAFAYEVVLTYVLTRKGGDQVSEAIDSRVKAEIEQYGSAALRIESFHSNIDMPRMISTMEEIEGAKADTPVSDRVRGVVATNIISHGVDIDRFNIMVFAGFPKQVAEYIQASARVGRQWPGLSILVITPQAERDRSVLHRFDKFHQYVDRLVEPVPINRWSEPALDLTIPGLIAAYLMGVVPKVIGREVYMVSHVCELFGMPGMEALEENAVCDWVLKALGATAPDVPPGLAAVARKLTARHYGRIHGAPPNLHRERLSLVLDAMMSLRNVDEPAWIKLSKDGAAALERLGL